jgi:3-phosphoshikimate 1-carboxyvinyltransferase
LSHVVDKGKEKWFTTGQLALTRAFTLTTKADIHVVSPAKNISGSVRIPGDKSISHRYAMLAAIAEGETRLSNFSTGADCASTLACIRQLGVGVERDAEGALIKGTGGRLQPATTALDCGNSGSTMRMLAGILAGQEFDSRLVGDASLSRRPMARVITPLEQMGARVESRRCCLPASMPPARAQWRSRCAPATTENWRCAPSARR